MYFLITNQVNSDQKHWVKKKSLSYLFGVKLWQWPISVVKKTQTTHNKHYCQSGAAPQTHLTQILHIFFFIWFNIYNQFVVKYFTLTLISGELRVTCCSVSKLYYVKLHFGLINLINVSHQFLSSAYQFCLKCNMLCHPQVEPPTPQPPSSSMSNHNSRYRGEKNFHLHYNPMSKGKPCQPVMSLREKQQMNLDTDSTTHTGWVKVYVWWILFFC